MVENFKNRKFQNKLRGHKASLAGESFEQIFMASCNAHGVAFIKQPKMGAIYNPKGEHRQIPKSIACDFIIGQTGRLALIDAKSTLSTNLEYSATRKPSFWRQILKLSKFDSEARSSVSVAGFVVYFRKHGRVVFFNPRDLFGLQSGQSFGPAHGQDLSYSIGLFRPDRILFPSAD